MEHPVIHHSKQALIAASISSSDSVLDVGYYGQGIPLDSKGWIHDLIKRQSKECYGLDLFKPEQRGFSDDRYFIGSAESFSIDHAFNVIFAGDLIEHLSNPGLFLERCRAHLLQGGRLILTTPNAFNLFNVFEKISKTEPTTNPDHTCYYNIKTLRTLLGKNGFEVDSYGFIVAGDWSYKESWKKKTLNAMYRMIGKVTPKFLETLYVVAKFRQPSSSDSVKTEL